MKVDAIQMLQEKNRKLMLHNARLIVACEKAKEAFLNIIDHDILPDGKTYDRDAWRLIDEMDAAITFDQKLEQKHESPNT